MSGGISKELEVVLKEVDPQFELCPRCRCCGMIWYECWNCSGEGWIECYDEDPLWYDEDDTRECEWCGGKGGHWDCGGKCDENGKHGNKSP